MEISYQHVPSTCKIVAIARESATLSQLAALSAPALPPTVALAEQDTCPRLDLRFHDLNYGAVAVVAREQQAAEPFALAIVEIREGAESTAEQIIRALYHTDLHLQILALLSEGAVPGKAMIDAMIRSSRLASLRLPARQEDLAQIVKLLTAKWARERAMQLTPEAAAAAKSIPAAAPSGDLNLAAIGSLAAGVAHEFNNFLTVIQSQMGLAAQYTKSMPEVAALLNQIMESARGVSHLSKKLGSLTPHGKCQPMALRLPEVVEDEVEMLRKTLGEEISLMLHQAPAVPPVWADPAVVGQIIMNVAVHAKSGMPNGGNLQFSMSEARLESGSGLAAEFAGAAPGAYVMLTVEDPNPPSDTASRREFETAAQDRLAWLKDALARCEGAFRYNVIPGVCRRYEMLFPVADKAAPAPAPLQASSAQPVTKAAPATILVVDDDETICTVMTQVLSNAQHRVLTATNADQGWSQWRQHHGTIKLVITDINMPGGANGVALGQAVQEEDATVPVVYTSGYRATSQFNHLIPGANYLAKPFGMNELLNVVGRNLARYQRHGLD
jgi:CheY-like chemotaxis protein/signal transduction histidine kinase